MWGRGSEEFGPGERGGTGMSQSGLGSKACSAGADLGSCLDREKRDKSPHSIGAAVRGVTDRDGPGHI